MQVFISHSSRHDPPSAELRTGVSRALRERDYQVLVDAEVLRPGEEWRSVLFHWLAVCDAAIVLLNQQALTSAWVRREVNILLWRRLLGAPVYVVPVLIDVTVGDLKANGLDELVPLHVVRHSPGDPVDATVDKIMAEFAELPPGHSRCDPMGKWIDRIAHYLDKIDPAKRAELESVARALGVCDEDLGQVRAPNGGSHFLAYQLLDRGHDGRLPLVMGELAPWLGDEPLERLLREVVPTWVDGAAARRILPRKDCAGQFVVALNAHEPSTAAQYIARATCCAIVGYSHEATGGVAVGEAGVGELVVEYENAIRSLIGLPVPWPLDDLHPPDGETYYLVVKPPERRTDLAAAAIRQVRQRFPWLVVILLTGSDPPDEENLRDWQLDDVVVLRPVLLPDDERKALVMIHQLRGLPGRLRLAQE